VRTIEDIREWVRMDGGAGIHSPPSRSRITLPNAGNPSMSETKSSYFCALQTRPFSVLRLQASSKSGSNGPVIK
jgi:hypothetical protein